MNEINDYEDKCKWKSDQPGLYIEDKWHQPELYMNEDVTWTSNGKCWNGPVNENMMDTKPTHNLRGLLVFNVDVGTMAATQANVFIASMEERLKDIIDKVNSDNIECVFVPNRTGETKVEYIKF